MKIFILLTDITTEERKHMLNIQADCDEIYKASNCVLNSDVEYAYITSDFMESVNIMVKSDIIIRPYLSKSSGINAMMNLAEHLKKTCVDYDVIINTKNVLKNFRKGDN